MMIKVIVKEFYEQTSKRIYHIENIERPTVKKNEVLVQVIACGLSDEDDKIQWELLNKPGSHKIAVGSEIAGIVKEVGFEVSSLSVGDEVVGIIPLCCNQSGCAEYAVLDEYDLTKIPPGVTFVDAAGCIGDALKAYIALYYLTRLRKGQTVFVMNGASSFGSMIIQRSHLWGAKVICTAFTDDEKLYLDGLNPQPALVIDLKNNINNLRHACLEETGSLGVDVVIDNGDFTMFTNDEVQYSVHDKQLAKIPSKHDLISILAVGGCWITCNPNLQLDPPNAKLLYLRGARIGFLFTQSWLLSASHQGRYQHILRDVMDKLAKGIIRPNIHHTVPFESVVEALKQLSEYKNGKVVTTI